MENDSLLGRSRCPQLRDNLVGKMDPEEKKTGFDPGGEERDKTIVAYVEWKNPPKDPDELQRALDWIQNEIIKAFLGKVEEEFRIEHSITSEEEMEILYGKEE